MVRQFSLWCTALILFTALASLGITGCGGGSGGAGSSGLTSQDLFGRMTIQVSPGEGPTEARVEGDKILLSTSSSSSTRRVVVELYRLESSPTPSPTSSPTPTMATSFDLAEGQTQCVIDDIPAPAHYRVDGWLYEGANAEYSSSFRVQDVEVVPGAAATASAWLTPRPSTSPTWSPTPSPSAVP